MQTTRARTPSPAAAAPDDAASFLASLERAELAGAACILGDVVRELRREGACPGACDDVVALLDAYHRHLRGAYRACPDRGEAPVLAFSSFARASRRAGRRAADRPDGRSERGPDRR